MTEEMMKEARFAGMDAFESGYPGTANPYCREIEPKLRDEWDDGYDYAKFMTECDR